MQTDTWGAALGWYVVGVLASLTGWFLVGAMTRVTGGGFSSPVALVVATTATAVLVGCRAAAPRRSRVAFVLGVLTPFAIVALGVAYIVWAFANSDWQF